MYSEWAVEILEMTKHRAGLVALISAPEIILAEIIYVVGALSLGRKNIKPFQILLKTNVDDLRDRDNPPQPLVTYKNIHYCKALGGYSSKVNDHIRDVLSNFSWMPELVPKLEGQVANFQSRVNFLLVMLAEHHDDTLWPDFARWDAWRITPLTRRIKYDVEFRRQVAELFGTQEKEIRVLFMNYLAQAQRRGLDKYFWLSVSSSDFLTEEEIRAGQEKKPNG